MTAHSAQEVKAQKKNSPNGDTSNLMRQLVVAALRLSVFEDYFQGKMFLWLHVSLPLSN